MSAVPPLASATGSVAGRRHFTLVAWMLLAIGGVTGLAWWDSQRESEAILQDVGNEQSMLASTMAVDLLAHLATVQRDALLIGEHGPSWATGRYSSVAVRRQGAPRAIDADPTRLVASIPIPDGQIVDVAVSASDLLGERPPAQRAGELLVLLSPPDETSFYSVDGRVLASSLLRDAMDRHLPTARLTRSAAADMGLLARTAMAGLARVDAGPLGRWGVAAVGTAARQRDRESRAFWRFVLGVAVVTGLVLGFGGIALRNQRKELEAQQQLRVAEMERERDDRLGRAERIATMGTFAMGVVHEVSTPLGVIVGRAEQLRGRVGQDERGVHAAEAIMEQVDRIQVVIRRFLDMARGGPPSLVRTNPGEVIRSAVETVDHRFAKAHVALSTDVPNDVRDVLCDRALLEQALVNLLLNACDACTPGGHVQVSTRSDTEQVAFVVTDDGPGIQPEVAARAKDPFFTTKPAGAGTGLGLAIASEIAKSHRGELTIAPQAERGTRACIDIPAAFQGGPHALR